MNPNDTVDMLRRGIMPKSRPVDEIIKYVWFLEGRLDGNERANTWWFHEHICPHWIDLLERTGEYDES